MIIAVDGPAASGKGTIARALADHYGLPHLDTGLLYRAVGWTVRQRGADPEKATDALACCVFDEAVLSNPDIRSETVSRLASIVSAHPAVRAALIERQRAFAAQPGGAVLDGRDIGTVITPDAHAKLYVTATPEIRAARRYAELCELGRSVTIEEVLADIIDRDTRDASRLTAPLSRASDADLLDTSSLSKGDSVRHAIALVEARINP